nr:PREDICTED: zinc finger protein 692-like [Anolis carolinensis]|eukprot:XP_016846324.1 PREDICTED: zinc finger protein 692-like [Anolis carolinensis]
MEHARKGRQRASETIRKQKRKELDARRGKCRIRIGSHLEQWCRLKEQLGFSLHSQLAKYLLDRYNSPSSVVKTGWLQHHSPSLSIRCTAGPCCPISQSQPRVRLHP